jgi:endonuclease/exonuclease/phosphatase (EEP) superfamily protein YafD
VFLAVLPWAWFIVRGSWSPLDVVAVVLPPLCLLALLGFGLVAARTGRLLALTAGVSAFLVAVAAVMLPRLPIDQARPADGIRIAAANVLHGNDSPDNAAAELAGRHADVLVIIEANRGLTRRVLTVSSLSERITIGRLSVLSRWPLVELRQPAALVGTPALRLRVERPDGPFVLHAVHAPNPLYQTTFEEQERLAAALVRVADAEALPAVIVGDLNLTDRAEGYRVLEASMRDAMRAGAWPGNTYRLHVWQVLLLRIDHLFVPNGWCAADPVTFDVPGSDHRGIEATVGPCPLA